MQIALIVIFGFIIGIVLSLFGLKITDYQWWIWCLVLNAANSFVTKWIIKLVKFALRV